MKYKYQLPERIIEQGYKMREFANGGAQVSLITKDGQVHRAVLISAPYIIAMRGVVDLPFLPEDIVEIYQTEEDKNPRERGGWQFWDEWK